MWCTHCQQDVPARAPSVSEPVECSQCKRPVQQHAKAPIADDSTAARLTCLNGEDADVSDEWQSQQRMRTIGRSLRRPITVARQSSEEGDLALFWREPAHATKLSMPEQQSKAAAMGGKQPTPEPSSRALSRQRVEQKRDRRAQSIAWFATVFGLGLALGGAGLMGMGMFGEYPIFWQWGVGVTLCGQAILIAGLVRVLLSLWNNSRNATQRLAGLQAELAEVQRTTEAMLAQRSGGASSFYGELARGASPALLMSNLKGQIDHLAARLHV